MNERTDRELLEPQDYLPALARYIARRRPPNGFMFGDPVLRIERKKNRHRETDGGAWGWYEITPIGVVIGYWGTERDDLRGVNIEAWNAKAASLDHRAAAAMAEGGEHG
ncbi:MAG: hypothetical protein HRT34_06630 [Alcanivorax sp.]|nr:hypothetical protein [Alcanivorax sp.]